VSFIQVGTYDYKKLVFEPGKLIINLKMVKKVTFFYILFNLKLLYYATS
jgi:hypothetical protein